MGRGGGPFAVSLAGHAGLILLLLMLPGVMPAPTKVDLTNAVEVVFMPPSPPPVAAQPPIPPVAEHPSPPPVVEQPPPPPVVEEPPPPPPAPPVAQAEPPPP